MIQKVKFIDEDNSKLFIVADLHLNHSPVKWENPIYKMRGYNSAAEMTTGIIRQINDTCLSTDTLLVIGDFCLNTSPEEFLSLVNRIHPKLVFLSGNHNSPWHKMYFEFCVEKYGCEAVGVEWLNKVVYWGDYQLFTWNKQTFCSFHYPMYVFDYMRHGCIALVGHSHNNCELSKPENNLSKQIDCGWDYWKKPISFKEIMQCANKKQIFKADHH